MCQGKRSRGYRYAITLPIPLPEHFNVPLPRQEESWVSLRDYPTNSAAQTKKEQYRLCYTSMEYMSTEQKIIVALDGLGLEDSLKLAKELQGHVWGFKAHELFIREGIEHVKTLKQYGNVFADFKFHDIPATVEKEVSAILDYGADLITVHASGGKEMLEAAVRGGGNAVVAVTVLTSLSEESTSHIYGDVPSAVVKKFATEAHEAGVKNIVCSPLEIQVVKEVDTNLRLIVPGIRLEETSDDQKRTMTPKEAVNAGADLLVVGRPITKAPQPREALEAIVASLA